MYLIIFAAVLAQIAVRADLGIARGTNETVVFVRLIPITLITNEMIRTARGKEDIHFLSVYSPTAATDYTLIIATLRAMAPH